jgi:hypothetical protein
MADELTSPATTNRENQRETKRLRRAMNENATNGLNAAGEAVELRLALKDLATRPAWSLEALGLQALARRHLSLIDAKYQRAVSP